MTAHTTRGLIHLHPTHDGLATVPAVLLPDTPEWNLAGRHVTVIRDPDMAPLDRLAVLPSWRARPWLTTTWDGGPEFYLRTTPHRHGDLDLAALIAGRAQR